MEEKKFFLDIEEIKKIIPHRYPFLLVDRILEFYDSDRVIGLKNVTANEQFFQGHFPSRPVMPGVLVIEAMAQVGAILAIKSTGGVDPSKTVFLVGVDGAKFKKQIVPGDALIIEMKSVKRRRPLWIMDGTVSVDGKIIAQATITAAEAD